MNLYLVHYTITKSQHPLNNFENSGIYKAECADLKSLLKWEEEIANKTNSGMPNNPISSHNVTILSFTKLQDSSIFDILESLKTDEEFRQTLSRLLYFRDTTNNVVNLIINYIKSKL